MSRTVTHPCISCKYVKLCGDLNRVEPCDVRFVTGRKIKGRNGGYYRYEVADSALKCVGGADTVEDVKSTIERYRESDKAHGFEPDNYAVFILNVVTGERLMQLEI